MTLPDAAAQTDALEAIELVEEDLIEEVSIDGMCGVY
jgi:mycofactocin precursor